MTRARLTSVAAGVLLAGCASSASPPAAPAAAARQVNVQEPRNAPAAAVEVFRLVNRQRTQIGCPPLIWDPLATRAAQHHSDDMYRRNFFAHVNPDRRNVGERLRDVGADWSMVAENLAQGQTTAEAAVQSWLASPGHRRNLEDCRYTHTGVGVREGRWTQIFLTPPR